MAEEAKVLGLFNEKVDKLEGLPFIQNVRSGRAGVRFSCDAKGRLLEATREGMTDESIDACVLTLRFFMQDNEALSIRNVATLYGQAVPALAPTFEKLRAELNAYLDGRSLITCDGKPLSRRDILETFVYGNLAHANAAKRAVFEAWKENTAFPMIENEFVTAVGHIAETLVNMRAVNKSAIAALPE